MKLSMSLIAGYLKIYSPECHILKDTATIKGVRMFSSSFTLDYVYVGQAAGYIEDPRYADAVLLASGQNQILCRGAEYEEILNEILSAFEFYGNFEQKLIMMSSGHESLHSILEMAGSVIEDPVFVFDIEGKLLASVHQDRLKDELLLNTMQSGEMLSRQVIGNVFLSRDGKISHDLADYPQHLHRINSDDIGSVAMYLIQDGERVGFIMIFPETLQSADMAVTLEPYLAAACSEAAEFTAKSSVSQGNHSIFLRLLQQETMPPAVLEKFRQGLHFSGNPILLLINNISIQNHTFRHLFMNYAENSGIPGISCEFNNHVAILTDEQHMREICESITGKVPLKTYAIGISMPVQRMDQLYTAYQQALFALNRESGPGVRHCREMAPDYLVSSLCEKEMAMKLLHPALQMLEEYDHLNNTDFYRTLQVYVKTGLNQTRAAKLLYIHLNTLKYRLRRISELCRIDFQNDDDIFYLMLSYRMSACRKK